MADKAYYERNRQRYLDKAKKWAAANPLRKKEIERNASYKRLYGITLGEYNRMYTEQKGLCALCDRPPFKEENFTVDHCHQTKRVRGLVHKKCNTALGLLDDDIVLVEKALSYLRKGMM